MINLFPHDKKTGKEFLRLNTLILRQANQVKTQQEESAKLKETVAQLSEKVK